MTDRAEATAKEYPLGWAACPDCAGLGIKPEVFDMDGVITKAFVGCRSCKETGSVPKITAGGNRTPRESIQALLAQVFADRDVYKRGLMDSSGFDEDEARFRSELQFYPKIELLEEKMAECR